VTRNSEKSYYDLAVGQAVQATLFKYPDDDAFRVYLEAGKLYNLSAFTELIHTTGSAGDIKLKLFDGNYTELVAGSSVGYPVLPDGRSTPEDQNSLGGSSLGEGRFFIPQSDGY